MKRLAALVAAALIGLSGAASGAPTAPPTPRYASTPKPPRAPRVIAIADKNAPERWTDPSATFSFDHPKGWDDIDTASLPGSPVLQIVVSAEKKGGECWFTRIPREKTAAMTPADLVVARSKPLDSAIWLRVATGQHLITGTPNLVESQVIAVAGWPVQTAWLTGTSGNVYAALHSRPGIDIWAFCAGDDSKDRGAGLRAIAQSVTTPRDPEWARQIRSQASLTTVP